MGTTVKKIQEKIPVYKLNYIPYAVLGTSFAWYFYLIGHGGTLPPDGSLYNFLGDTWDFLLIGGSAPIATLFITNYLRKRKESK